MGRVRVETTALGLARALWTYGEDDLWARALRLSVAEMCDIGERAGELYCMETVKQWGGRQSSGVALVVAAIELLSGETRWPARRRRRGENRMPPELVATEEERWADPQLQALSAEFHRRDAERDLET